MQIRHLARHLLPALVATAAGLAAAPPAQAQMTSDKLSDFMIMDVCVDQHDRVLADQVPGDPGCSRRRNIRAGEELFYDYGLIIDDRYTPKLKKQYECRCGSKKCRGTMLAPKR